MIAAKSQELSLRLEAKHYTWSKMSSRSVTTSNVSQIVKFLSRLESPKLVSWAVPSALTNRYARSSFHAKKFLLNSALKKELNKLKIQKFTTHRCVMMQAQWLFSKMSQRVILLKKKWHLTWKILWFTARMTKNAAKLNLDQDLKKRYSFTSSAVMSILSRQNPNQTLNEGYNI